MFWKTKKKEQNLDYVKTVQSLKDSKKELLSGLFTNAFDVEKTIRNFNDDTVVNDIPFSEMLGYPENEWIEINDKVKTRVIFKSLKKLILEAVLEKGGGVKAHIHSDCTESMSINKGCLLNAVNGKKYTKNQTVIFQKGEEHEVIALDELHLIVYMDAN